MFGFRKTICPVREINKREKCSNSKWKWNWNQMKQNIDFLVNARKEITLRFKEINSPNARKKQIPLCLCESEWKKDTETIHRGRAKHFLLTINWKKIVHYTPARWIFFLFALVLGEWKNDTTQIKRHKHLKNTLLVFLVYLFSRNARKRKSPSLNYLAPVFFSLTPPRFPLIFGGMGDSRWIILSSAKTQTRPTRLYSAWGPVPDGLRLDHPSTTRNFFTKQNHFGFRFCFKKNGWKRRLAFTYRIDTFTTLRV